MTRRSDDPEWRSTKARILRLHRAMWTPPEISADTGVPEEQIHLMLHRYGRWPHLIPNHRDPWIEEAAK